MTEGLYSLVLKRLKEIDAPRSGVIRFPYVFEKLCRNFSITKKQCWDILLMLRDFDFIEIIPGHGIKLIDKDADKNNEPEKLN